MPSFEEDEGSDEVEAETDFRGLDDEEETFASTLVAIESTTGATSTTVMDGVALAALGGSHMRTSAGHGSCGCCG